MLAKKDEPAVRALSRFLGIPVEEVLSMAVEALRERFLGTMPNSKPKPAPEPKALPKPTVEVSSAPADRRRRQNLKAGERTRKGNVSIAGITENTELEVDGVRATLRAWAKHPDCHFSISGLKQRTARGILAPKDIVFGEKKTHHGGKKKTPQGIAEPGPPA